MGSKKPTEADAGRLVRRAVEILEDRGRVRRMLVMGRHDKPEAFCTAGAINYAYCGNGALTRSRIQNIPLLRLTYKLLDEFLAPFHPVGSNIYEDEGKTYVWRIEHFNDKTTDNEEVLRILNKFADEHDPKKY